MHTHTVFGTHHSRRVPLLSYSPSSQNWRGTQLWTTTRIPYCAVDVGCGEQSRRSDSVVAEDGGRWPTAESIRIPDSGASGYII